MNRTENSFFYRSNNNHLKTGVKPSLTGYFGNKIYRQFIYKMVVKKCPITEQKIIPSFVQRSLIHFLFFVQRGHVTFF